MDGFVIKSVMIDNFGREKKCLDGRFCKKKKVITEDFVKKVLDNG